MSWFELDAILSQYYENYKDGWEKTRIISYYCVASFSKIKMQDIIKFPWDEKVNNKQTKTAKSPASISADQQKVMCEIANSKQKFEVTATLFNS